MSNMKFQMDIKYFITSFCILLFSLNSVFSQSDTLRWGKYLFIESRLSENGSVRYVYEYQDTLGNVIIPQKKYGQLGAPDEYGFINAWKQVSSDDAEGNVGFIDIHDSVLIPFVYSRVFSFNHILACARRNGKYGFINRKGEPVIPFIYDSYADFYDDGVAVLKNGNKDVLIDTLGNEIIGVNHGFDEINENFPNDHVLWVKQNEKWAFFDLKGKPLTPFIFDDMHPANICSYQPNLWNGEELRWFYMGLTVVEKGGQLAVLNEKMEYVVPWDTYQWISPMSIGGLMIVKQKNKYGLLNHQLKLMQPIEFDTISNYPSINHEQNYPSFWAKKNGKYYIFDSLGKWKDNIEYDGVSLLQANFYLVRKGGLKWRLDRFGNPIIEDFKIVGQDEDGFIVKKDSLFGYIDTRNEMILPFEYEDIIGEHLGNIFVKKNGKWGVVNDKNQQLLPCLYDYIAYAWDNDKNKDSRNYIVVQNDKFGKVTETGNQIFPCMYDGITTWVEYGPDGHYVMIGNKMGLIDETGNTMIPIQYESVVCLDGTKWAIIYDKGKMGLFDLINKSFFLPLEYDYLHVDYDLFEFEKGKPTRIITYINGVVNILDEKGEVVQSNVSKSKLKQEHEIDVDAFHYSLCTYELSLMIHNRTYLPPDCLLKVIKERKKNLESLYFKMGQN